MGLHTKRWGGYALSFFDAVMQLLVHWKDIRHVPPGKSASCQHTPHLLQFLPEQALPLQLRLARETHDNQLIADIGQSCVNTVFPWGHNLTYVLRRGSEAVEDHCLLSAAALNLKRMI